LLAVIPVLAPRAQQVLPVSQEPRHHKRFENEYFRVLEVIVPPGDTTLFHAHTRDMGLVQLQSTEVKSEEPNNPEAAISRTKAGAIGFWDVQNGHPYPYIHRVTTIGPDALYLIGFEIVNPSPGGFAESDRTGALAYAPVIDNNRARAWRLKVEPGQSVPSITQSAPGLRVILSGDRMTETINATAREINLKPGSFEWQPSGTTRALKNTGTSPIELAEWELK
jgi:quercetin dioxygenase-like cupin family protein